MPKLLTRFRFFSSVLGLYSLTLLLLWQAFKPLIPALSTPVAAQNFVPTEIGDYLDTPVNIKSGIPTRIVISSLGIDKPILPGRYEESSGIWEVSDSQIHYATPSSPVNDYSGNTLVYGHNNNQVLGKLVDLSPGDEVNIYTDKNLLFKYILSERKDSNPNDVSILKVDGPPTLILQTCSGIFNEIRSLYIFNLGKVEAI